MTGSSWVGDDSADDADRLEAPRARRERLAALTGRAASERVADAMFALSTPSRIQILSALVSGPRTVGELTGLLAMEQSAVSHQLRVLREHHLVRADRVGRRRVYQLQSEHLAVLLAAALDHTTGADGRVRGQPRNAGGARAAEGPS